MSTLRVFSTMGDTMSTPGDIMKTVGDIINTPGDVQYPEVSYKLNCFPSDLLHIYHYIPPVYS